MITSNEHQLLIQAIYRPARKWQILFRKRPTQNKVFWYGLKIKNIAKNPFPSGMIKNINISSLEGKSLINKCLKNFKIKTLNPDDEQLIWVEKFFNSLSGIIWLNCLLEADDKKNIFSYQYDKGTRESTRYESINKWGDSSYVFSSFEYHQRITNKLLIILTALVLLETIWGIKDILIFILKTLGRLFDFLSIVINGLI